VLLACITDSSQSADDLLDPAGGGTLSRLSDDKKDHLLALRGLLDRGLLLHCLQRRHRVHYGISRCPLTMLVFASVCVCVCVSMH
jgi:hypothetical protein